MYTAREAQQRFKVFDAIYSFSATTTTVVLPFYLLDLGLNVEELSLLFTLLFLVLPIARVLVGYLVDRGKAPFLLPLSAVAGAVSSLLYLLGKGAAVALGQLFKALSSASFWGMQRALAFSLGGKRYMVAVVALTFLAYGGGYLLASLLLYIGTYSWVFLVNAFLFSAIALLSLSIKVKGRPSKAKLAGVLRIRKGLLGRALLNGLFRAWILVVTILHLPYILSHLPAWMGVLFIGSLYVALSLGMLAGRSVGYYKLILLLSLLMAYVFIDTQRYEILPFLFFLLGVVADREELASLRLLRKSMPATDLALYWLPPYLLSALLSLLYPFLQHYTALLHLLLYVPLLYYLVKG